MLSFLRKYQKIIFVFVSTVVGLSMLFFGTFSKGAGSQEPAVDKTVVMKLPSGREVTRDQMDKMVRFLTEKYLIEEREGGLPLSLHDGVLEKDFFYTGWASLISQKYQKEISEELATKLDGEKAFKLYRHPSMPMIAVDQVWKQSLPELSEAYINFRRHLTFSQTSPEAFDSRINLYVLSQALPPNLVKRLLVYQQNLFGGDEPDPALYHTDLSLFSYRTAEDWFGKRFIHLMAQLVFQLSDVAKAKGIKVSDKEAEIDLVLKAKDNFMHVKEAGGARVDPASFSQHFAYSLRRQGITEKEAIAMWKDVLSYRKWFQSLSSGALVDNLSLKMFGDYASKSCDLELVDLPSHLQFASNRGSEELAAYMVATTDKVKNVDLAQPFGAQLKSIDKIKSEYPLLVQQRLKVGVKRVNLEELAQDVTIKDMLNWQFKESSWNLLKEKFPELGTSEVHDAKGRMDAIRSLSKEVQDDVDLFSREQIALNRLGNVDQALENGQYQEEEWITLADGRILAGPTVRNESLYKSLRSTPLNQLITWQTDDQTAFLSIEVLAREDDTLLTFKELKDYKLIENFTDSFVARHHEAVKTTQPDLLKDKEGETKEAKRSLGSVVEHFIGKKPHQFTEGLFHNWLIAARNMRVENKDLPKAQMSASEAFSPRVVAEGQWALEAREQNLGRSAGHPFLDFDALFSSEEGAFSNVQTSSVGNVYFYTVKKFSDVESLSRGVELQEALSLELKKEVFESELGHIADNKALSLSYLDSAPNS